MMSVSPEAEGEVSSAILWRQVWALATMLAAILLSFMIYGFYQPPILTELGFGNLASQWGILQGLLGGIIEPAFGSLSDVILRRTGSRLPQIAVGVTIAGLIFGVTALLLPTTIVDTLRWLLLLLMTLWLMAMIAVRGPIIALLRQAAPVNQLPIANEVIILVLGLVSAFSPLLTILLQSQSAAVVFMIGAIILMVGTVVLYQAPVQPILPLPANRAALALTRWQWQQRLVPILFVGIGTGCILDLLLSILPTVLQSSLGGISVKGIASIALLIAALATNPCGWLTRRWGAARALQVGLGGLVGVLLLATWPLSTVAAMLVLGIGSIMLGLVFISMVPFALSYVPLSLTGLSAGLFFGGNGIGSAIAAICQQSFVNFTPLTSFGVSAIAFGLSAFCLSLFSQKTRIRNELSNFD